MEERDRIYAALFFCLFLSGCGRVTADKALRTFFDGVPGREEAQKKEVKPSKAAGDKNTKAGVVPAEFPRQYFHQPFLENQCDSCHDVKSSQKVALAGKELCFSCHDDFSKGKKTVHYPVSEGACLDCHDPHQSPNKHILNKPEPKACFTCHDEKEIKANPAHEGKTICTECHDPHASNEEKLLK